MLVQEPWLLIPVENQVRELDPKLLLACLAGRRGFPSVIGSRREMELEIDSFPPSIYLSKSMTVRSLLFFRIARKFGHEIVTWDEEALVHLPPETYFSRRLHPSAIKYVSHLFAWGKDNVELWRQYPHLPADTPIHLTGNPRSDMLRPELRSFYKDEIEEILRKYGDFILIATNFNHVNAFGADMNLFKPVKNPGQKPAFGRAARGMSRKYAEGLRDHKQAIFEHFQRLIPDVERTFPGHTVIVRPHPTENHDVYRKIADQCDRVHVTNEGNIVPWLRAARVLIHNGCTTGVEAYMMGVPAVSYRAVVNGDYDDGFYILPHRLSHQCFSFEHLRETLEKILNGNLGAADGDDRRTFVQQYLTAQDGPLACERMLDVLESIMNEKKDSSGGALLKKIEKWAVTRGLHLVKRFKASWPGSHNRPEFQRHRFPGINRDNLKIQISKFQQILGDETELNVEQISNVLFRINP